LKISTTVTAGPSSRSTFLKSATLLAPMAMLGMGPSAFGPILAEIHKEFATNPGANWLVPMVLTLPAVCIALFSGAAGMIADRFGRKRLLMGSLLLFGLAGAAPFFLKSLGAILASRFLVGVAEAGLAISSTTLIGDEFEGAAREKMLASQVVVAASAAVVVAVAAGGLGALGWRHAVLVYLLALPLLALVVFVVREPRASERYVRKDKPASLQVFPWKPTFAACGLMLVTSMFFCVLPVEMAFVMSAIGVSDPKIIGLSMAAMAVGIGVGAGLFKTLSRLGIPLVLTLGYAVMAAGFLSIAFASNLPWTIAACFVTQIGAGLALPAVLAAALKLFSFEFRGFGTGLVQCANSLGQFVCALVVTGLAMMLSGLSGAMTVLALLAATAAACAGVFYLRGRRPALGAQVADPAE